MSRDMHISVPDERFDGYIVHDYESWAVPWGRASELYRNASIALATTQLPPGSSAAAIAARAEKDYDAAALAFLTLTINVTRTLRPHAAGVGFYGYPAHTYWGDETRQAQLNDQLLPLWKAQTAFYPSLYLPYGTLPECHGAGCANATMQNAWIDGGVRESVRVAGLAATGACTLPYAWYRYHDGEPHGLQLLNTSDAHLEFVRPFEAGGAHVPYVIIWGSERNATQVQELENWLGRQADIFGKPTECKPMEQLGAASAAAAAAAATAATAASYVPGVMVGQGQHSSAGTFSRAAAIPPFTHCGL